MNRVQLREKKLVEMTLIQYKSLYKSCLDDYGWVSQPNFIDVYGALIIAFRLIEDKDEDEQAE